MSYNNALNEFGFGGNFSVDIVPVFSTDCQGNNGNGRNAISLGYVAYTYTITVTINIGNTATQPDATATHSEVCPGDGPITLMGSTTATGTNITYNWTSPSGFMTTGENVDTADPAEEGTYTLRVDVDGCLSDPVTVEVEYLPFDPEVNAVDNSVCFGENIELEVTNGGTNFAWFDPAGSPVGGNSSTLTTPAGGAAGIQTYSVTVSNADCSETLTIPITVSDEITGVISVDPVGGVCVGTPTNFTAQMTGGSAGLTFEWNGESASGPNYSFTQTVPGSYSMMVVVTNPATNCSETLSVGYEVNGSGGIPGRIVSDPVAGVCAGDDITFSAEMTDGTDFPPGWTFDWDGGNGSGDTYLYQAESIPDDYLMQVTVESPSGCFSTLMATYTVFALPTVSIDPETTVCLGDTVVLDADANGGTGVYDYIWNQDVGETGTTLTIDINSPFTDVIVDITDENGCMAFDFADVFFLTPPQGVTFNACPIGSETEITFSWDDVGQTAFELYLSVSGGAAQTISTNYTNLSYTATGLTPGTSVTLEVVPAAISNVTTCYGQPQSWTCSTDNVACDNPGWLFTPIDPICLTTDGQLFDLIINTTETGTVVLNSTDLSLSNDQPNGPGGMTTVNLPALPGGTSIDTFTVMASFTLSDGSCPFDTTFNIPVVTPADPEISTLSSSICATQAEILFSLVNAYDPNSTYTISVDNPSGVLIAPEDAPNPFRISFSEYRTYQIRVTTTTGNNACTRSFMLPFTLTEPPARPNLTCAERGLDSVAFSWPDVGADGYTIDSIALPGAAVTEQTANGFIVRGLSSGDEVTIAVTASSAGCPSAISDTITCIAQSCPPIAPQITTPVDTFCSDGSEMLVDLTVNVPGAGNVEWSGTGVINLNQFDPTDASVGEHEITVVYTEGACTDSASFQLVVVDPPSGMVDIATDSICQGGTAIVSFAGMNLDNAAFEWIFPATAAVVSGDVTGPGPLEVSFSGEGFQSAQLVITGPFCEIDTLRDSVFVEVPIAPLDLICAETGLDSVAFSWSDVGAIYAVDQIMIPGTGVGEQTATGFIVRGLVAGESVTIAVTATAAGLCPSAISDTITCFAQACPPIVPQITTPVDTFCSDGSEMLVDLTVNVPGAGNVEWSGTGVINLNQFDPTDASVGEHEITVVYTEGACTDSASFQLVVVDPPSGTVDIAVDNICQGGTATVNFAGTNLDNAEFEWVLPATAVVVSGDVTSPGPLEVSFSGEGFQSTQLVITGPFCEIDTLRDSIFVEVPIAPLDLICAETGLDSVAFSWSDVGAIYAVDQIMIPGTGVGEQTATGFIVRGLSSGDEVTIAVTATAAGLCPSAISDTITCIAQTCPGISFDIEQVGPFCVGADVTIQLDTTSIGSDGSGTLTFADSTYSTGGNFNSTGLAPGLYTVTAVYEEGGCPFSSSIDIEITDLPDASFTLPVDSTCIDEVVGADAGAEMALWSYDWTIGDAAATVVETSATTREISWPSIGTKDVVLTVMDENGCENQSTESIEVVAPLSAPSVSCGTITSTSVEFNWNTEAGVDSFQVSVNGGVAFFQDSSNLVVDGLIEDEVVNIQVIAFSSGACGNSLMGMGDCQAESCPIISVTPPNDQVFCLGAAGNVLALTATQIGAGGTGAFTFNGPGVTENGGVYSFDADAAGAGVHPITVMYDESPCSGMAMFEFTVTALPTSDFTLNGQAMNLTVCEGEAFTLAYSGDLPQASNGTFNWDTISAIGGADGGYQSYSLSYATAGDYVINLSVDDSGCSSASTQLNVTVEAPLSAPSVSCGTRTSTSVEFNWNTEAGVDSFQVSVNGGVAFFQDSSSLFVDGLIEDEVVNIQVVAFSSGACGGNSAVNANCMANSCPLGIIQATTLVQSVCLDGTEVRIPLTAELTEGTINGSVTWTGTGVVTNGTNFVFDPAGLPAGDYPLAVNYDGPANCDSEDEVIITVEATVDAGTPLGTLELCITTTDPINLNQRVTGGMPGGTWSVVSGGVPNGNLEANTGILSPAGLTEGSYTFAYTIAGGACPDDNAQVVLDLLGAPVANAGTDQRLTCNMGMVSLNGSNSEAGEGYTYQWTSDNPSNVIMDADQMMVDVSQPGTYTLRVTNAIGCTATSDVVVTAETEAPVMEIELSQVTCFASDNGAINVTNVSGGRPPYTFSFNSEDRAQSTLFSGLEPAEYDLQVTDADGCFSNILVDITEPGELTVSLLFPGGSTTASPGDNIFISTTINGGNPIDTLIWEPDSLVMTDGQNGISFIADETRMISVTVVDELGCTASDRMMLLVRRDRPAYFPTAFSPNDDNINDIFFINGDLDQIDFIDNFFIFNRWGEAVFSSDQVVNGNTVPGGNGSSFLPNDTDFGWDGRLNGQFLNPQVLVYTATIHFNNGEVVVYKGDFVLMR